MDYKIVKDVPGEGLEILVNSTIMSGTDTEINAALPMADVGTVIHTAGYAAIKEKGVDGSWTAVS